MNYKKIQILAWSVSIISIVLAITAWGQSVSWELGSISSYQLFPLFGLLAFSLMWGHYLMHSLRVYFKIEKNALKQYFEITSLAVLGAILLHPGLLAWQLWRDGLGLPPSSELNYVSSGMKIAVILGMISVMVFLAYELRRNFGNKKWWKYVQIASDAAILLIVVHSLKLGTNLQTGWFRLVWLFYVFTLLISLVYIYVDKFNAPRKVK